LPRLAEDACLDTPGADRLKVFARLQMTVATRPLPEAYRACSLGLPSDDGVVIIQCMTHHEKGSGELRHQDDEPPSLPRLRSLSGHPSTIAGGIALT
jgi:hypothetical protein